MAGASQDSSAPAGAPALPDWPVQAIGDALAPLLPGLSVEVLPEIDSTNTELMRRARAGHPQPVLLVAQQQTAGRGRMGRSWDSGAGQALVQSLTFSLGTPLALADWSGLSLAVGVALAESLHPDIRLKWPNDLWLADRKLGGILIETASFGAGSEAGRYAVIGVGINLTERPAEGLSTAPAWLGEVLPGVTAPAALQRVAGPLVQALKAFEAFGFEPFRARFEARDALRERAVTLSDGSTGTAHGVGPDGALLVHTASGMRAISSSEVSVRPVA